MPGVKAISAGCAHVGSLNDYSLAANSFIPVGVSRLDVPGHGEGQP